MAVRERVKRHVVKRTSDLYQEVSAEINTVKRLLDGVKRVPETSPVLPPRAAQAFRAGHLSHRLEMTWETLQRVQVRPTALSRVSSTLPHTCGAGAHAVTLAGDAAGGHGRRDVRGGGERIHAHAERALGLCGAGALLLARGREPAPRARPRLPPARRQRRRGWPSQLQLQQDLPYGLPGGALPAAPTPALPASDIRCGISA